VGVFVRRPGMRSPPPLAVCFRHSFCSLLDPPPPHLPSSCAPLMSAPDSTRIKIHPSLPQSSWATSPPPSPPAPHRADQPPNFRHKPRAPRPSPAGPNPTSPPFSTSRYTTAPAPGPRPPLPPSTPLPPPPTLLLDGCNSPPPPPPPPSYLLIATASWVP